jgi:hypothetical protein
LGTRKDLVEATKDGIEVFPGKEIVIERQQLMEDIALRRNPKALSPLEVLGQAQPVGKEVFDSAFFANNSAFYMLYEHPVHWNRNRLFYVEKMDLLHFLDAKIYPERMEGLDVTIVTTDLQGFLICNHDGEMYLLPAT